MIYYTSVSLPLNNANSLPTTDVSELKHVASFHEKPFQRYLTRRCLFSPFYRWSMQSRSVSSIAQRDYVAECFKKGGKHTPDGQK